MKIIFLDIDGVVNCTQNHIGSLSEKDRLEFMNRKRTTIDGEDVRLFDVPDPTAIRYLNKILKKTEAKVVISSSWRGMGIKKLSIILKEEGIDCEIIGTTCQFTHFNTLKEWSNDEALHDYFKNSGYDVLRGHQIKDWILTHPEIDIESYIIIDDDSDMLKEQEANFVHVQNEFGITRKDKIKAINILNGVELLS